MPTTQEVIAGLISQQPEQHKVPESVGRIARSYRALALSVLLLAFTILTFYLPMRKSFWNSSDEGEMLYLTNSQPFTTVVALSNKFEARPLEMLGVELAQVLSPNAIDGFLWLAFMLRFASALFLYGIVCELFSSRRLALIASLLFIVNPSEPWRFVVIVMMDYYLALSLLLLSVWLYLRSYRLGKLTMLLAACIALMGTLLIRESSFLLAIAVPVLLLAKPVKPQLRVWIAAWMTILVIMAARFLLFITSTPDSYQHSLASHVSSFGQALDNLRTQFGAIFSYFTGATQIGTYLAYGLLLVLITISALLISTETKRIGFKRYGIGIVLAGIGILLAIAPYFAFSDPHRTQFFAAPVQAVMVTLVIGGIGVLLPRRLHNLWLISAVGFLILSATAGAWQYQNEQIKIAAPFNKIVHIWEQVHRIAPRMTPGTLVLFVISDGQSPFGERNYQLMALSRLAVGVDACQANLSWGKNPTFNADGIVLATESTEPPRQVDRYDYSQVVAFKISPAVTVTLLEALPPSLLPAEASISRYNPHARIQTDHEQSSTLRFLHYSHWLTPYQPSFDIVAQDSRIELGDSWYALEHDSRDKWRWVHNDAEFTIDGKSPKALSVELESGLSDRSLELQIIDEQGMILYGARVWGRQTLRVALPGTHSYRLHAANGDPRPYNFRVFRISADQ